MRSMSLKKELVSWRLGMSIKRRISNLELKAGGGFHVVFQINNEDQEEAFDAYCKRHSLDPTNSTLVFLSKEDLATL